MDFERIIENLLIPHNTEYEKLRVGSDTGDGGYIVSNVTTTYDALYSYGCDDATTFETDFYEKYNTESFVYDHTVDGITNKPEYVHFFKQGVAPTPSQDGTLDTLKNHIAKNGHQDKTNLFLQMDIEGAEWSVLLNAERDTLRQFSQMCFEFHMWGPAQNVPAFAEVFSKIDQDFVCTHVHANNYCPARLGNVPRVMEVSYVRKDLVKVKEVDNREYPTELDRANNKNAPDLKLSWWVKV